MTDILEYSPANHLLHGNKSYITIEDNDCTNIESVCKCTPSSDRQTESKQLRDPRKHYQWIKLQWRINLIVD